MTQNQSEALDSQIDKMLTWEIDGEKEPVIFSPEMKKAIIKLVKEREAALMNRIEEAMPEKCKETRGSTQNPDNPMYSTKFAKGYNSALEEVKQLLQKEREKLK